MVRIEETSCSPSGILACGSWWLLLKNVLAADAVQRNAPPANMVTMLGGVRDETSTRWCGLIRTDRRGLVTAATVTAPATGGCFLLFMTILGGSCYPRCQIMKKKGFALYSRAAQSRYYELWFSEVDAMPLGLETCTSL
uniref:Putative secreted protein n=1 Tax=Ixodes ricinus TaxID=34613 RepID=A0A6B0UT36_IXORI